MNFCTNQHDCFCQPLTIRHEHRNFCILYLSELGRHQLIKLGIARELVDKRHKRAADLEKPLSCADIRDIAELKVGDIKELGNYYLKHNFEKEYSDLGTPYVQENCDLLTSDNLVIYGHHIKGQKMFGALENYKSKDFYEEHKTIRFDTLTKRGEYEIIAVFKTVAYSSAGFRYYDFVNAEDENAFNAYISKCKELALYDTGVTAEYGDRLITLSTCEYSAQNGRLVVVAKRAA